MEKQAFFQDFQQKVMDLIKASPAADIERNIKALMGQTFNKLELVSREEFDIQAALLQSLQAR
ncbi:MAG: accessory factor UbiK family protein, partial [Lautropia mirabilis]